MFEVPTEGNETMSTEIADLPDGDYLRQLLERVVVEAQMRAADPAQFHRVPDMDSRSVSSVSARLRGGDVVQAYAEELPRGISFSPAGSADDEARKESLREAGEDAIDYRLKVATALVDLHARFGSASTGTNPRYEIESAIGSLLLLASSLGQNPLEVALCAVNEYGEAVWRNDQD